MYKIRCTKITTNRDCNVIHQFTHYEVRKYFSINKAYRFIDAMYTLFNKDMESLNNNKDVEMSANYIVNTESVRKEIRKKELNENILWLRTYHKDVGIILNVFWTIEKC